MKDAEKIKRINADARRKVSDLVKEKEKAISSHSKQQKL